MELAPLPGHIGEHLVHSVPDAFVGIGRDHQKALESALFQSVQEVIPGILGLIVIHAKANDFTVSLIVRCQSDHKRLGHDPVVLPNLEIGGIYSQEGIVLGERTVPKLLNGSTEILAEVGDRRLGERCATEGFNHLGHLPGGDPIDNHFRHTGNECGLAATVVLKDHGLERLIPMARNMHHKRPNPSREIPVSEAIAAIGPFFSPLVGRSLQLFL